MNHSKPKIVGPTKPNCPVCGKITYSPGGIHPQCASERQDKVILATRKEKEKNSAGSAAAMTSPRPQWTKSCPRCKRQLPARRAVCECGFSFLKKTD